jgi:PAS domain-containing protein
MAKGLASGAASCGARRDRWGAWIGGKLDSGDRFSVSHASPFLNRLSIRPLVDREGQVIYYLGVLYDITDQIRTHEALEKLQFELEQRAGG